MRVTSHPDTPHPTPPSTPSPPHSPETTATAKSPRAHQSRCQVTSSSAACARSAAPTATGAGEVPVRRTVCRMVAAAVLGAVLLSVATADSAQGSTQVVALAASVSQVFDNIRSWLIGILAGLATVFLTVGGVRYLMAGGDPGEVEKAKTAFKSAGWGYGLAALAPVVVDILKRIVGAE